MEENTYKYVYMIDPQERLVRCCLIDRVNGDCAIDVAKCHRDDEFDVNKGMEIAKLRATISYKKLGANRIARKLHKMNKIAKDADLLASYRSDMIEYIKGLERREKDLCS